MHAVDNFNRVYERILHAPKDILIQNLNFVAHERSFEKRGKCFQGYDLYFDIKDALIVRTTRYY